MRPNPFVYGEVVPQAAFVDREEELDRLRRDLDDGQKVFLISPRRYGKSSLIPNESAGRPPPRLPATDEASGLMWICCEPVSAVDWPRMGCVSGEAHRSKSADPAHPDVNRL
jgi:hypothetical protein